MISLQLPKAVSLNQLYDGRRRLSGAAWQWKAHARASVVSQGVTEADRVSGEFMSLVIAHPDANNNQALDLDNTCKLMFDVLQQENLIDDDKLNRGLFVLPGEEKDGGGLSVYIVEPEKIDIDKIFQAFAVIDI